MRLFAILGVLVAGCSVETPTQPSATTAATIRSVSLSRSGVELVVGAADALSATATYSDGSTRAASAVWNTSNSSIVGVDQAGNIRAFNGGLATITANVSGVTASATVKSLPDYTGRWVGGFKILSCVAPARWGQSYCSTIAGPVGAIYAMELNLTMSGSRVTGVWRRGMLQGSVSGTIADDGSLSLQGSEIAPLPNGQTYAFQIRSWQSSISGNQMIGRWDSIGFLSGESQTAVQEYELISVFKQ